jgi:hypothetical protein
MNHGGGETPDAHQVNPDDLIEAPKGFPGPGSPGDLDAPSPLGGIAMRVEEEKPVHTGANFFIPTLLCHCVRARALVRRTEWRASTGSNGANRLGSYPQCWQATPLNRGRFPQDHFLA